MTTIAAAPLTRSPASPADPIELRCLRDVTLTAIALERRQDVLEKLAKKADDEGYPRQAREFRQDALAIEEDILPVLREQRELPLVTSAEMRGGIAEAFRDLVHSTLVRHRADVDGDEDLATRCWSAGYAARKDDPDVHVMRSIDKLRNRLEA